MTNTIVQYVLEFGKALLMCVGFASIVGLVLFVLVVIKDWWDNR
jgi:hypothetical protein